ncbi:MAG TPA: hypothetical protein VF952_13285 [Chloroflexia bacterium]
MPRLPLGMPNLAVAAYLALLVMAVVVTFSLIPNNKSNVQPDVYSPTDIGAEPTGQPSDLAQVTPPFAGTPDATATQRAIEAAEHRRKYSNSFYHLDRTRYGKQLELSQTVDGYTVIVKWVYADGNRILVECALGSPDARSIFPGAEINLVDSRGNVYPTLGSEVILTDELSTGFISSFDTSQFPSSLDVRDLKLTMNLDARTIMPRPTRGSLLTPSATPISPPTSQMQNGRELNIAGPFNFSFEVPFIPARIATLNQTERANDISVTLEQVRVSPAEVRAIFSVEPLSLTIRQGWSLEVFAKVNDWYKGKMRYGGSSSGRAIAGGRWIESIYDYTFDQRGEWTVQVLRFRPLDGLPVEGPWIFKFEVPVLLLK